jgi:Calx-beta domain
MSIQFTTPTLAVDQNTYTALIDVERASVNGTPATVDYETRDGTAIEGTDYVKTKGTLTFGPGSNTRASIAIRITGQSTSGAGKSLVVVLSNPSTGDVLGPNASITINIIARRGFRAFLQRPNTTRVAAHASLVLLLIFGTLSVSFSMYHVGWLKARQLTSCLSSPYRGCLDGWKPRSIISEVFGVFYSVI